MQHFAKFARPDIVPRITQIKNPIPEEILGKRVKAFGVSTPALTREGKTAFDDYGRRIHRPSKYTVYPSDGSNKAEGVLGHAHYLELDKPEFKLSRSGMYSTRGYKSPKAGLTDIQGLELSSRAKTLIHPVTGEKIVAGEKTPYAFVHGNLDKKQNFEALPSKEEIDRLSDYPWQSGRMNKVKMQELLNGGSDSFINIKTGKRFVGEQEFDSLLNRDKSDVQVVKKARLSPYGIDAFSNNFSHMAEFGVIKQQNKLQKGIVDGLYQKAHNEKWTYNPAISDLENDNIRNNYLKTAVKEKFSLYPKNKLGIDEFPSANTVKQGRYIRNYMPKSNDPLSEKRTVKSILKNNTDDWSDIRRVNDSAASDTKFLGFRKDPYKGYGGMMEEPVPVNEMLTKNSRVTKNSPLYNNY